jgi:hypothetical protein
MVGINGIGGVPEPKGERPAKVREKERDVGQVVAQRDDVVISSEAQAAAKLANSLQSIALESDVRTNRVDAAREHLASGQYKNPDVVAIVAERVGKYLP